MLGLRLGRCQVPCNQLLDSLWLTGVCCCRRLAIVYSMGSLHRLQQICKGSHIRLVFS